MKKLIILIASLTFVLLFSNCEKCEYDSGNCQTCPTGFVRNVANNNCEKIATTNATFNDTLFSIIKGDSNSAYGMNGADHYILPSTPVYPITSPALGGGNFLQDGNATPVILATNPLSAPFWKDRLNVSGVWSAGVGLFQWNGFSECITTTQDSTKICIGIAADNRCRFKISGVSTAPSPWLVEMNTANTHNFRSWHVFEFTLLAGKHIIAMQGLNDGLDAAFGAEIYEGSYVDLNSWTSAAELDAALLFSTKDKVGTNFQTGEISGWSCPSGYSVDFCSGDSIPVCTDIQIVNYLPCQTIVIN